MQERNEFYAILGVKPSVSQDELKTAFRRLVRIYHPDINPDPSAVERLQEVIHAYHEIAESDEHKPSIWTYVRNSSSDEAPTSHSKSCVRTQKSCITPHQPYKRRRLVVALGLSATLGYFSLLTGQYNRAVGITDTANISTMVQQARSPGKQLSDSITQEKILIELTPPRVFLDPSPDQNRKELIVLARLQYDVANKLKVHYRKHASMQTSLREKKQSLKLSAYYEVFGKWLGCVEYKLRGRDVDQKLAYYSKIMQKSQLSYEKKADLPNNQSAEPIESPYRIASVYW